jgi:hypothetical protein
MKKLLWTGALACLVVSPVAQAQDGGAVFKPTGAWTADFGDDYCRLIRTFSDGKDEVSLAFERTQPGAPVRLIFVGDGVKTFRGADEIGYSFLPGGSAAKSRYVRSETPDGKQYLNFDPVTLSPVAFTPGAPPPKYDRTAEQEAARGINGLALAEGLTDPVRFETGSLRAPIATMQTCADDLLKVWGLDAEKHKTMTAMAVLSPNSDGVLPQGTIPFGEFGKLTGGANQVRLLIGADGKVTGCTIYSPSLSQTLNDKICNLAKERASFQPAKDATGQAMASVWMGSPMFLGPPFPGGGRR